MDATLKYILIGLAIIVVLVIFLIGGIVYTFLQTRSTTSTHSLDKQSLNYWKQQTPFSMTSYQWSGKTLTLILKNNDVEQLTITRITGTDIEKKGINTLFASGQERPIIVETSAPCGTPGTSFQISNIRIDYKKEGLGEAYQIGNVPLVGKCS